MEKEQLNPSVEAQTETTESYNGTESLQLLVEASQRKIIKIKAEILQQLETIQNQLKQTPEQSAQYLNLKNNEQFYKSALGDAELLQQSISQKSQQFTDLQKESPKDLAIKDLVVSVDVKQPPHPQEKTIEKATVDAAFINQLRGLTPEQNLFLRQDKSQTLDVLRTDIALKTNTTDGKKLTELRYGNTVVQVPTRQNENQREERQLPFKERQRVRQRIRG